MLTKIIGSHPEIGMLMEAIMGNRQRHQTKPKFWSNPKQYTHQINRLYNNLHEPIIGNKVCTPDVWSNSDILQFCNEFKEYDIIWIVRNPYDNLLSRHNREPDDHYSLEAHKKLPLNYSDRFYTWSSSWRQNLENYSRIKEFNPTRTHLIYYDDIVNNFEQEVKILFHKLQIPFSEEILRWHEIEHYNSKGQKRKDLKYKDQKVSKRSQKFSDQTLKSISASLKSANHWVELWENREL